MGIWLGCTLSLRIDRASDVTLAAVTNDAPANFPAVRVRFPKLASDVDRVNAGLLPPGFLITGTVHGAVMRAAERDGKFIAGFAAERLHKSDVMRIRGLAAAQQAGLLHHKAEVVPVAIAPRCRKGERALVDSVGLIGVAVCCRERRMRQQDQHAWSSCGPTLASTP